LYADRRSKQHTDKFLISWSKFLHPTNFALKEVPKSYIFTKTKYNVHKMLICFKLLVTGILTDGVLGPWGDWSFPCGFKSRSSKYYVCWYRDYSLSYKITMCKVRGSVVKRVMPESSRYYIQRHILKDRRPSTTACWAMGQVN
jgi:hypothetical protein